MGTHNLHLVSIWWYNDKSYFLERRIKMNFWKNYWGHFKTITQHKLMVMKYCFKVGLYKQGLLHDLSKYSPSEFWDGVKYYQGDRSPNSAQREIEGCSKAWLHHKGRNKHHFEYWIDYTPPNTGEIRLAGMPMPTNYVIEMFCDRIAASKTYNKEKYTDRSPLVYFLKGQEHYVIHKDAEELLHKLLIMLAENGEEYTFKYIRKKILHK